MSGHIARLLHPNYTRTQTGCTPTDSGLVIVTGVISVGAFVCVQVTIGSESGSLSTVVATVCFDYRWGLGSVDPSNS